MKKEIEFIWNGEIFTCEAHLFREDLAFFWDGKKFAVLQGPWGRYWEIVYWEDLGEEGLQELAQVWEEFIHESL